MTKQSSPLGPLIVDIEGKALTHHDRELLRHPLIGGVILFTRNYENKIQIKELVRQVKSLRHPELLVCVDQEGGRVQRFKQDFIELPPLHTLGELYDQAPAQALEFSGQLAALMAQELTPLGIDFSFAPVVDLYDASSQIIANRAFHHDPQIISRLALAYMQGLHENGMIAVAKHFPGHGSVIEDSHLCLPTDRRCFQQVANSDLIPYQFLIENGLDALMSAHVLFNTIDVLPSGFSSFWLNEILRKSMNFQGLIFTDDLSMQGAVEFGSIIERTKLAFNAGCDIALICNDRHAVEAVLSDSSLQSIVDPDSSLHIRCRKLQKQTNLLSKSQIKNMLNSLNKFV